MDDYKITCFVGSPGSGKSSTAQYIILDCLKKNKKVWSNMPFYGAYKLDLDDLGKYELTKEGEEGVLIIDEAGIAYNSREWKGLPKNVLEFLKYHRHYRLDVYFFSQADDMDRAIRSLSQQWYKIIKLPLLLNRFSALIPVEVQLVIKGGEWALDYVANPNIFSWTYIPIYKTWGFYDSFSRKPLLSKEFEKWDINITPKINIISKFKNKISLFLKKFFNFIKKILFKKKINDKIKKNLKDGEYFNN